MTTQEAIKTVRELWRETNDPWYEETYDKAISALEKQIPKKPHEVQDKYNKNLFNLYCTSCANWIGIGNSRLKRVDMYNNSNNKICPYCGQAIAWEEYEQ